jgi:DNA topoisomerase I
VIDTIILDPKESAKYAGLRYVNDFEPGIIRIKKGKGYSYKDSSGKVVKDKATLARIKSLIIPPAWKEEWICEDKNGHLQATGKDARGRKQYRYHPKWREVRDETKYHKMVEFGAALPAIRARVEKDISQPGMSKTKVLATIVELLDKTLIRVGNHEYATSNESYGLTTLRDKHVRVEKDTVHFAFKGKSGVKHAIDLKDKRLAKIIKQSKDLPGYNLFQYVDEYGNRHDINSSDVNAYLKEITNDEFTAKDFRTWHGTIGAVEALLELGECEQETQIKKNIVKAVDQVSHQLGNTKAVCRKCYIHPNVIQAYTKGDLKTWFANNDNGGADQVDKTSAELRTIERYVITFLEEFS